MSGRTKLGMGLTQTGSDEGGSTGRTSQQISNYSKRKRSPIYKKNPRGKIIKIGMLSGGQSKLDKNKNNKIDAEDFALLRKEKSKGKPMKAVLGAIALGAAGALGAKKLFKKKKATANPGKGPIRMGSATGIGGMAADLVEKKKKELMGAKRGKFSNVMGKSSAIKTAPGSIASKAEVKQATKRLGKFIPKKIKTIGALLGAAGAGAVGQKLIDKMKKKNKKMGGGMMQRPMGMMRPMGMARKGKMIKARGGGMARTKPTSMY